jgi:ABC-type sugar transport system ATPase subunit
VREPDVFLFDEPLSNLDAALRVSTRVEIAKLHKLLKATMVYVTHDQTEAMTLADRIVVMSQGVIAQVGKPLDLYYTPANLFVAGFIGSPAMNFFAAKVEAKDASGVTLSGPNLPVFTLPAPHSAPAVGAKLTVGVRPEHLSIGAAGRFHFQATIELIERLGETSNAYLRSGDQGSIIAEIKGREVPEVGAALTLSAADQDLHIFDEAGQRVALV